MLIFIVRMKDGVYLIDTASVYGNEKEVGEAVRQVIVEGMIRREDVLLVVLAGVSFICFLRWLLAELSW